MRARARAATLFAAVIGLTMSLGPTAGADILPDAEQEQAVVMFAHTIGTETNSAGETIRGGCFFVTINQQILTNGINEGVIGAAAVTTGPNNAPIGATVTCAIYVNGIFLPGTEVDATSTAFESNSMQIAFPAPAGSTVELCQKVTFIPSGRTVPDRCQAATEVDAPPQVVFNTLQSASVQVIDPTLCPILIALGQFTGGGVLGVVDIAPDGDIYVPLLRGTGLEWVYDCPPY